MEIQKFTIKNFGVYTGINTIDLNVNEGKNIVLIDGNNGYGKTTLTKALYYCLYGIKEKYKERLDYLNEYSLANQDLNTVAEVYFMHGGKHYQITRSLRALTPNITKVNDVDESVTMLEDGVPVSNIDNRINDILPKEASQFFFFDGEDIKKYASLENPDATKEAIELVLGLPSIKNSIQDLDSIHKGLIRKRKQEMEKTKNQADLVETEEKIIDEIKLKQGKFDEAKQTLEQLRKAKEKIQDQLEEHKVIQPILEAKKKLMEKDADLNEKIKEINIEEKELYEKVSYLVVKPLIEKFESKIRNEINTKKQLYDERATAVAMLNEIDRILKTKRCICGNKIDDLERNILLEKQNKYKKTTKKKAEIVLGKLMEKQQQLNEMLLKINQIEIRYDNILERKDKLLFDADETFSELKNINKKLRDTLDQEGYENLKKKYNEVELKIAKLSEDVKWFEDDLMTLNNKLEEIQNKILELKIKSPKLKKLNNQISLIDTSLKALDKYLERITKIKKRRIEEEGTKIFKELTHKKEVFTNIKINDDYTMSIINNEKKAVDNEKISAGEKQILALSFIAGLRQSTDKKAPIVMDTPFGRLDHEHKVNVMNFLHRLGSQIVILATDEDVNQDNINLIAPYIGKKYEISFISNKKSSIIVEET